MTDKRRHDEEAYDDLRTLNALAKKKGTVVSRVYDLLRLLSRIKNEDADLWERLKKFAERSY